MKMDLSILDKMGIGYETPKNFGDWTDQFNVHLPGGFYPAQWVDENQIVIYDRKNGNTMITINY